jgi:glycerate-2-kinase
MPPVSEQMALPGSRTNPDLIAARFLLKSGRKYEQAVKAFEPYDSIKEENPEARAAGRALIAEGKAAGPKRRTFIFVNNRLEGNALVTIGAMLQPG